MSNARRVRQPRHPARHPPPARSAHGARRVGSRRSRPIRLDDAGPPWEAWRRRSPSCAARKRSTFGRSPAACRCSPAMPIARPLRRARRTGVHARPPDRRGRSGAVPRHPRAVRLRPGVHRGVDATGHRARRRRGVCQDFAHLADRRACACSGCRRATSAATSRPTAAGGRRLVGADASHAWCSVWVPRARLGRLRPDERSPAGRPPRHGGVGTRLRRRRAGPRRVVIGPPA